MFPLQGKIQASNWNKANGGKQQAETNAPASSTSEHKCTSEAGLGRRPHHRHTARQTEARACQWRRANKAAARLGVDLGRMHCALVPVAGHLHALRRCNGLHLRVAYRRKGALAAGRGYSCSYSLRSWRWCRSLSKSFAGSQQFMLTRRATCRQVTSKPACISQHSLTHVKLSQCSADCAGLVDRLFPPVERDISKQL